MTAKELIEELKKFPENYLVSVWGGEGPEGDFAVLQVHADLDELEWQKGPILMTKENTIDLLWSTD